MSPVSTIRASARRRPRSRPAPRSAPAWVTAGRPSSAPAACRSMPPVQTRRERRAPASCCRDGRGKGPATRLGVRAAGRPVVPTAPGDDEELGVAGCGRRLEPQPVRARDGAGAVERDERDVLSGVGEDLERAERVQLVHPVEHQHVDRHGVSLTGPRRHVVWQDCQCPPKPAIRWRSWRCPRSSAFDLAIPCQVFGHRDEAGRYAVTVCARDDDPVPTTTAMRSSSSHGRLADARDVPTPSWCPASTSRAGAR